MSSFPEEHRDTEAPQEPPALPGTGDPTPVKLRIVSLLLSEVWGEAGRKGGRQMFASFLLFKESVGFFSIYMDFQGKCSH